MSTALRVAGFLVGLAAVFGLALGTGNAVGPVVEAPVNGHADEPGDAADGDAAAHGDTAGDSAPGDQVEAELPGGLMVSQDGYALRLADTTAEPGDAVPVSFVVEGPDGKPVTEFEVDHEKRLHLIAVRRDQTGFQHVHPEMSADGTWRIPLALTPGSWRLFADFVPAGGDGLTLGADLSVAGDFHPVPAATTSRVDRVGPYEVRLSGDLTPGADSKLTLTVAKNGEPVIDLQPYLGSYGHLVALREGDLAYLHVHPDGAPGDGATEPGPDVVFYASVPSAGSYRLYLDFRHGGVVRTAEFALGTADASAPAADHDDTASESDDHADDSH